MKVAIVGAGVSGLVVARKLLLDHEITVFEANSYPGGHVNTVTVETSQQTHENTGKTSVLAIDTGFIVFNDWTYPNFIALLDELGVASQPTEMSFSVKDPGRRLE